MIKIESTLTQEKRDEIEARRANPGCPQQIFTKGSEVWLRVKITDPLAAEESIIPLIQNPVNPEAIQGADKLGFELQEVGYFNGSGLCNIYDAKQEIINFIDNELEFRLTVDMRNRPRGGC